MAASQGGGGKGLGNRANGKIERGEKLVAYLVEASQFRGSATVRGTVGQHRDKAGGGGGAVRDRVVEARAGYRVAAGGLEGDGLAAVEQRWDFPPPQVKSRPQSKKLALVQRSTSSRQKANRHRSSFPNVIYPPSNLSKLCFVDWDTQFARFGICSDPIYVTQKK